MARPRAKVRTYSTGFRGNRAEMDALDAYARLKGTSRNGALRLLCRELPTYQEVKNPATIA